MTDSTPQFTYLRDPRLAAHALNPAPVWLWNADADRILWANPAGAAIFDAPSPSDAASLRFDARHPASVQVARLSGMLPQGSAPRLERLRGFGASIGATLICLCSRIALVDDRAAILIVAAERAGRNLALPERATRLLRDMDSPSALFTADGEIIAAQPEAAERMGARRDLVSLGAEKLAREASLSGTADGECQAGHLTLIKMGAGSTFALLAVFAEPEVTSRTDARPKAKSDVRKASGVAETQAQQRPFRFVWQTDGETRFTLANPDFADLLGPKFNAALGRTWADIAKSLQLDADGKFAGVLSRQETFGGIAMHWPVDGLEQPLAIEMSGLPAFDGERRFAGFRGFGLCRDMDRLRDARKRQRKQAAAGEPAKVLAFPASPAPVTGPA
jgi:PAS domain-containing protein